MPDTICRCRLARSISGMSPRSALLALFALLFAAAVVLAFTPRSISVDLEESASCGSVVQPADNQIMDDISGGNVVGECDHALGTMRTLSFGAAGLGVIALIASFLASPTAPSAATKRSWMR